MEVEVKNIFFLVLADLPKEGPQISGKTQDEYEIGDNLALNCTSAESFPPARLSWYINDLPVSTHNLALVSENFFSPIYNLQ